ncbi:FAD-binding domain-containing protein [Sodiomyces alkalinus F11]|uniref:FAD-binding domain-containing protein n=1 Tax=Sodiomyces alkalinus (strain CBS 110278 / VKM F-3762 / F11) TaxID=1314773 RepID=A0A3N2PWY7_SODAK|nr:FAD-binding domain-containing protein [Sodiomyces alkalinus F11]ROT38916.1 FAD-binding domain-containing protein [Sodiomyces alkalinus F11]
MGAPLRRLLCGLTFLQALVAASPLPQGVPRYFRREPCSPHALLLRQLQQDLADDLSDGSLIFGPSNPAWDETIERWQMLSRPEIQVVVQPAEESDISKIVEYCSDNSIDFLAVNRGHGFTASLGSFKGVQIDMKQLTGLTIAEDGKSALFQGGSHAKEVIKTLWDQGYVTTTGSNECVGLTGPALGGGHGRFEGLYGLISDNILHLNVVLADGSEIGVNETSHEELFWAMQGAGHNFGIVTSMRLKIYPAQSATWHWHNYYWTEDKLEAVFEAWNGLLDNGNGPVLMGSSYGQISFFPDLNEYDPLLWWTFAYNGPADEAEEFLAPFNAIESISDEMGDVPYPEIVDPQDTGEASCGSGQFAFATVLLQTYNVTTERELYNHFNETAARYPELATVARLYHQGYATKAIREIDYDSTAYPHRDEILLALFLTLVPDGADEEMTEAAWTWAKESWALWQSGQPGREPATYVNYATGYDFETLEGIYGREPWRLEKLLRLKAEYDPNNRFRFYVPLVSS